MKQLRNSISSFTFVSLFSVLLFSMATVDVSAQSKGRSNSRTRTTRTTGNRNVSRKTNNQKNTRISKKQQSVSSSLRIKGDSNNNKRFNRAFTVRGVPFTMVYVQGGTFTMGATSEQGSDAHYDEKPVHRVTLSNYYIGQTEVNQELWYAVMEGNPSKFKGNKRPVENVSWNDCQTFISKLNSMTGEHFRLPTEAEWEYAARGGNKSRRYKYSGSNNLSDVAWHYESADGEIYWKGEDQIIFYSPNHVAEELEGTYNVATKSPNELSIYDMSGNVMEWCNDWFGSYNSGSRTNPKGPSSGSFRVNRGGSWINYARCCRVAFRDHNSPTSTFNNLGLRLAL